MNGQTLQEWAGSSRLFALVFTDIVDSTTIANDLHDEKWIEVLLKHFAQARRLMAEYDHHEIKIIGDSFMVVFRDVCDALDFALALQADTGDERIRIRAGIHSGSARIVDDDIFGIMVNYTKRVESTQHLVGIRLSDVARNQIKDEGATRHFGLRFNELELPFKGFAEPQTIWSVFKPRSPWAPQRLARVPLPPVSRVPEEPKIIPPKTPKSL
jgi:class 3 adenylate cyclase